MRYLLHPGLDSRLCEHRKDRQGPCSHGARFQRPKNRTQIKHLSAVIWGPEGNTGEAAPSERMAQETDMQAEEDGRERGFQAHDRAAGRGRPEEGKSPVEPEVKAGRRG